MNKLAFMLVMAAFLSLSCTQEAKRTQQAGPFEITAVGTEYQLWRCQDGSITGWGVRVRVTNISDQQVSEYIGPVGLEITNALGKRYNIPDNFLPMFTKINLEQLSSQKLEGDLLIFDTGSAIRILDSNTVVGTLTTILNGEKKQTNFNLQLSPKKSVTVVFVFNSPEESPPQTLTWPKAKPIDLR
ncbi:MAG: hypothetical protein WAO19_07440 [Candidatus Kryptoniota bacterium]